MNRLMLKVTAIVVILVVSSVQADMTVIDFESLGDLVLVDDQFLSLGVDFNGTATTLSKSSGSLNWDQFPPYSGDKVVYDYPTGTVRADAVGQLWNMVGGYVTGNTNIVMTAYDSGGNVLGTDQTGGANYIGSGTGLPPNIFLSVSASNIAYVMFADTGNTYTIDDFTFTQVPVPGAVLLGMLGLSVAGIKLRKFA